MEHPLLEIDPNLTVDQLQEKINDLTKKLSWAYRSGNGNLADQIQMALETYRNRYFEKLSDMQNQKNSPDYSDRINIS